MSKKIDKQFIEDTKKLIDLLEFGIDFYSTRPGIVRRYKEELEKNLFDLVDVADLKYKVFQAAYQITMCNEILGDNPNEELLNRLDEILTCCSAFKKINWPDNFTNEDIRKNTRNLFAHANYTWIDDDTVLLEYEEYGIKSIINYKEFREIANYYYDASMIVRNNNRNRLYTLPKKLFDIRSKDAIKKQVNEMKKVNNNKAGNLIYSLMDRNDGTLIGKENKDIDTRLKRTYSDKFSIEELQIGLALIDKGLEKFMLYILRNVEDKEEITNIILKNAMSDIPQEEKDLVYNLISYYSIIWNKMSFNSKTKLIGDFIMTGLSNYPLFKYGSFYITDMYKMILEQDKDMSYINLPLGYASLLMDLTYLSFGYIKEKYQEEDNNILYRDYDLKGLKIKPKYKKDKVVVEYKSLLQKEIDNLNQQILKRNKKLNKLNKQKDNILKSNKQVPSILEEQIKLLEEEIKELQAKKELLVNDYMSKKDTYINQNEIFSHIRNSITHCYYIIDFSKALETNNMSNLIIIFEDYNKNTKEKTFEATIKAKDLLNICNQFKISLNQFSNRFDILNPKK